MNKTKLVQKQYVFENLKLFHFICGISDQNIIELERILEVDLIPRGSSFIIRSEEPKKIEKTIYFFDKLCEYYQDRQLESFDTKYLYKILFSEEIESKNQDTNHEFIEQEKIFVTYRGKPIYAKTINQHNYIKSLLNYDITIAIGPAGTGKTFLAVVVASKLLLKGEIERLIITRPAVEAGENLGFLPGDMVQKVDPYLRPIYDSLFESFGVEKTSQLIQLNKIEVAPLAYMRGRSLNDSLIILDEAQNCTLSQLKMFLTRIGRNSRMCISGDITQTDLKPGQSGLSKLLKILKSIEEVNIIEFNKNDIVRNPIVEKVIHAFEKYENETSNLSKNTS